MHIVSRLRQLHISHCLVTYFSTMLTKFTSILNATKPYQIIFWLCGTAPFPITVTDETSVRNLKLIISCVYKLFIITFTFYVSYEVCTIFAIQGNFQNDFLTSSLQFAQIITLTMTYSMMQLVVLLKWNSLWDIVMEIIKVEQELWIISSKSNKTINSRMVFGRRLFCISGFMLFTVLIGPLTNIYAYILQLYPLLNWSTAVLSEMSIRCKSVEFCVFVQAFNEILDNLLNCAIDLQKDFNTLNNRFLIDRLLLQRRILHIQSVQSKLWKIINVLTDYFSIPILFHFVFNGLSITNILYWVYVKFNDENSFINLSRLLSLSFLLMDILLPCYLCDICVHTYGRILRLIHDFKTFDSDIIMKMCLREYSLQLTHQKLVFSCGGYFKINLQCFGEIVLAITTYIVILIQFKLQAEKS